MPSKSKRQTLIEDWGYAALSTIIKLSNIIGYLPGDIGKTLDTVVEEVYKLFVPEFCCVYLVYDQKGLGPVAYKGISLEKLRDVHINHSMDSCVALRDGLPYVACDEAVCPNRKSFILPDYSHVCIPLVTGKEVYGVFSITIDANKKMSKRELDVLLSIISQTSAAIQRYRLFEKLRNEKAEIERAYREIKKLNSILQDKIEELKHAQQKLIQSEKLAATGMLSAGLCHEINNPLSIILNRIECLKIEAKELQLPQQVLKDLDVIYANASKVSSIVQDLLIFSRHHPVKFGFAQIDQIIERTLNMLQDSISTGKYNVVVNLDKELPPLYCDKDRIEQVFMNILSNAIDAMPEGGNIYINASLSETKPGYIEVSIRDEGNGIPEEHLDKIFDPFFTTKSLGKGTGLGLSICYGIVKAHKGEIKVTSVPQQGSTFSVVLPYKEEVLK